MKHDTPSLIEKYLFYSFLLLLVWLPLPLGSNRPWAWSIMEGWVFCLAISWLLLLIIGKTHINKNIKQAKLFILIFAGFVFWGLLQITPLPSDWVKLLSPATYSYIEQSKLPTTGYLTIAIDLSASQASSIKTICYFFIFLLTLALVTTRKRLLLLAYTLLACGVFQATYGSLMTLSGLEKSFFIDKISYLGVATGTFVNRNHLAGYLEMTLAIGIGLMIANLHAPPPKNWRERTRQFLITLLGPKARIRLALAIMVIALVLTQSRMGNTAFFASLAICGLIGICATLWLSRKKTSQKQSNRPLIILFASLMIIDVFIVGAWFGIDKIAERMENTSFASETRDEVSQYSLMILKDFATTGTGGGSFYSIFPAYNQIPIGGFYDHAHNDYLQFASEFGLVGIALLGLLVFFSFSKSIALQFNSQSYTQRGLAFASSMGILSLMIHSSVDFNLQIPANAALFILLLAIPWLRTPFEHSNHPH